MNIGGYLFIRNNEDLFENFASERGKEDLSFGEQMVVF